MGYDRELNPVLDKASNEELIPLRDYIIKKFSNFITTNDTYQAFPDQPRMYKDVIADEIRTMGGHTLANLFRGGEGVSYHEVCCDVADKLKVNYNKNSSAERIEECILNKIFEDAWEKMSETERKKALDALPGGNSFHGEVVMMSVQTLIKTTGFKPYMVSVIVANGIADAFLGHGLPFVVNKALTKSISIFAGPIGWVVSGLWTVLDLMGPSYKTTIPCVVHVAMLRRLHQ